MKHPNIERRAHGRLTFYALCLYAALWNTAAGDEPMLARLEVEVTGFESSQGELAIALFDSAEGYANQTNAVRKAYLAIENGKSRWVLDDLPVGEYALIAYHDLNGNREIDMRFFGMPKESVGVSNDARGRFGPPKFDAAKFELLAPLTRHAFELR